MQLGELSLRTGWSASLSSLSARTVRKSWVEERRKRARRRRVGMCREIAMARAAAEVVEWWWWWWCFDQLTFADCFFLLLRTRVV